jgi:hypothetical protein
MSTSTQFGFIDDEYKPAFAYFFSIEKIHDSGWILLLCGKKFLAKNFIVMIYLWYGLILIKLKYLNPVLEDICEIFDEKKSYITKSLFYLFYQNIDL